MFEDTWCLKVIGQSKVRPLLQIHKQIVKFSQKDSVSRDAIVLWYLPCRGYFWAIINIDQLRAWQICVLDSADGPQGLVMWRIPHFGETEQLKRPWLFGQKRKNQEFRVNFSIGGLNFNFNAYVKFGTQQEAVGQSALLPFRLFCMNHGTQICYATRPWCVICRTFLQWRSWTSRYLLSKTLICTAVIFFCNILTLALIVIRQTEQSAELQAGATSIAIQYSERYPLL
jgi:hypothetical protein